MNVFTYETSGGKDLIKEYLDNLPKKESAEGYFIIESLEKEGVNFLEALNTRQLDKKLWEIKFYRHNRIMYVLVDQDNIYLLHACKKQKNKAEKLDLDKAQKRADELLKILNKK
ncbi:type II toxin-antitoxin system RelE/ParE family toxin [Inediibacterium massiliense]|uniref:type II toxin-antitoxin system RelE/ParE family toxin n=1 Tax=Inediibacterium massiliense TaxID=1658111 RepID=UPI0006B60036|nr:type II toxin-antitoxin system RelE/ParE family toxin [Inediibacterium massiliense]